MEDDFSGPPCSKTPTPTTIYILNIVSYIQSARALFSQLPFQIGSKFLFFFFFIYVCAFSGLINQCILESSVHVLKMNINPIARINVGKKKCMTLVHSPYNQREGKRIAPKQCTEYKRAKLDKTVETRGTSDGLGTKNGPGIFTNQRPNPGDGAIR